MPEDDVPPDVQITPTGRARAIYKDGHRDLYEALGKPKVKRASNVEWEEINGLTGWTVRAAHDPEIAIRHTGFNKWEVSRDPTARIVTFPTREEALASEVKNFWALLPEER